MALSCAYPLFRIRFVTVKFFQVQLISCLTVPNSLQENTLKHVSSVQQIDYNYWAKNMVKTDVDNIKMNVQYFFNIQRFKTVCRILITYV